MQRGTESTGHGGLGQEAKFLGGDQMGNHLAGCGPRQHQCKRDTSVHHSCIISDGNSFRNSHEQI